MLNDKGHCVCPLCMGTHQTYTRIVEEDLADVFMFNMAQPHHITMAWEEINQQLDHERVNLNNIHSEEPYKLRYILNLWYDEIYEALEELGITPPGRYTHE